MSGTVRAGLVFGLAGVFAFLGGLLLPIPCVNMVLAFGSLIALGWGAGNTAAKTTGAGPGQGVGRGLTAGAIAGTIVLIGSVLVFLLIQYIPGVRDQVNLAMQQAAQQNPEAGNVDAGAMLGLGLGIAGFACGVINFILMLIGGAIGGMMWKGTPATTYVPAGGSYVPNQSYSSTDQPYGTPQQGYRDPGEPGGARVYDPNDPNRPQ
jgi:hypothetical protein